jgi:hypothetical protein
MYMEYPITEGHFINTRVLVKPLTLSQHWYYNVCMYIILRYLKHLKGSMTIILNFTCVLYAVNYKQSNFVKKVNTILTLQIYVICYNGIFVVLNQCLL